MLDACGHVSVRHALRRTAFALLSRFAVPTSSSSRWIPSPCTRRPSPSLGSGSSTAPSTGRDLTCTPSSTAMRPLSCPFASRACGRAGVSTRRGDSGPSPSVPPLCHRGAPPPGPGAWGHHHPDPGRDRADRGDPVGAPPAPWTERGNTGGRAWKSGMTRTPGARTAARIAETPLCPGDSKAPRTCAALL